MKKIPPCLDKSIYGCAELWEIGVFHPRGHKVLAMSCLKKDAQKSSEFRVSSYPPADPHRCSGRATPHERRSERGAQTFHEPSPGSARFFWEISQVKIERSWKIQAAELKNVYHLLNQFSGFRQKWKIQQQIVGFESQCSWLFLIVPRNLEVPRFACLDQVVEAHIVRNDEVFLHIPLHKE